MNLYTDIILRAICVYAFMIIAIRLFGKKELSQLAVTDLVFILLISNAVQNAMVGPDTSLQGGLMAAGCLFVVNALLKYLMYKNKHINAIVQGHPVMLIHKGQIIAENLLKQDISKEELEASAREHGVAHITDVDLAVLEVDGNISILSNNYKHKTSNKRKHRARKQQIR